MIVPVEHQPARSEPDDERILPGEPDAGHPVAVWVVVPIRFTLH